MAALDLFFSYSHRDEPLRAGLEMHLALMVREGLIRPWHDLRIDAGGEWKKEIHRRLESAHLILLLISADFIASEYCYAIEMKRAIERHDAQEARVVPIILRPCDWQSAPFGKLQALPSNAEPVTSWQDRDAAFTDIAQGLRRLIAQVQEWQELDGAYEHRAVLMARGGDTTEIDKRILELKRDRRLGGRLQPGDFFGDGRYKLQELLGQGGFATVWRAYDRERQELVAIKVLHAQYAHDRSRRERFFRGARQMARLRDLPGIVDIVERQGHDDGFHFYVMEYVAGGDFRRAVLDGRLSVEQRMDILLDIGETLHAAHQRGIIHRDVKPANILLDRQDRPKLTDFDLVRAADTTGGTRTSKLGTFLYAAPEAMMDASRATVSADVYGLAMTAIFALHGEDLPQDVYFEQQEFLAGLKVDDALRQALARGVARKVEKRWASVEQLCEALRAAAKISAAAAEKADADSAVDPDARDASTARPDASKSSEKNSGPLSPVAGDQAAAAERVKAKGWQSSRDRETPLTHRVRERKGEGASAVRRIAVPLVEAASKAGGRVAQSRRRRAWRVFGFSAASVLVLAALIGYFGSESLQSPEKRVQEPVANQQVSGEPKERPRESAANSAAEASSAATEGDVDDRQPPAELVSEAESEQAVASQAARPGAIKDASESTNPSTAKQLAGSPDSENAPGARGSEMAPEGSGAAESHDDLSGEELGEQRAPEPGELWAEPSYGMRFRYVPAGTFQMGSPPDEPGRFDKESQHEVTLTQGFWLGETEVTQRQWRELMGSDPSRFDACGDECPVERVNWFEAVAFANALSKKAGWRRCYEVSGANGKSAGDGLTYASVERIAGCTGFRLPTEAEWERAARAGTATAIYSGDMHIAGLNNAPALDPIAWYCGNSAAEYAGAFDCSNWPEKQVTDLRTCGPQPVAGKQANAWQLYDMLGNVWEWCEDWSGSYPESAIDPAGPEMGSGRVIRGGSWDALARYVRAAYRDGGPPGLRDGLVGFRLARGQVSPEGR